MPSTIPNFLNNTRSPLGNAFANLSAQLAAQPTEAAAQKEADQALLGHWKVKGYEGMGDQLQSGFEPGVAPSVGTGGPNVSPVAASNPSQAAPSPLGATMRNLAPASPGSAPSEESIAQGVSAPNTGAGSPIVAAFGQPPAPAQPQIKMGDYTRNALFAGVTPENAGGYIRLGDAVTYGARDPRTINATVGAGGSYGSTAEQFDIGQSNDLHKADQTDATSRSNNAATQATSRANNAANISKDYGIASMHEGREDARNERTAGKTDRKEAAANQARLQTADVVDSKVDEALNHVNGMTAGLGSAITSRIPGGEGYTLGKTIDTIKANLGFDTLAAMRAASPTGGALGAVSDFENRMLQSTVASLDQGLPPAELKKNLGEVKKHYANVRALASGQPLPYPPKADNAPAADAPAAASGETWVRGPDGNLQRAH